MKIRKAMEVLEAKAPLSTQEAWDNGGLLLGDPDWPAKKAVVATDLTREVMVQARKSKGSFLVLHHPPIFPRGKGISSLVRTGNPETLSDLLLECAEKRIAVLSWHTSFDSCSEENAHEIAGLLGFQAKGKLNVPGAEGVLRKLRVFVPETHHEVVRDALAEAGAGHIGNYDSCSFSAKGEGTFRGLKGTRPKIGKPGKRERVPERVIETIYPKGLESRILNALRKAHPYEEIAFDLLPLLQKPSAIGFPPGIGMGFWAESSRALSIPELRRRLGKAFRLKGLRVTAPAKCSGRISRIGFLPGKGSSFGMAAKRQGCQAFVTGELDYHEALALSRSGVTVFELGHPQSERFTVLRLARWLEEAGFYAAPCFSQLQSVWSQD